MQRYLIVGAIVYPSYFLEAANGELSELWDPFVALEGHDPFCAACHAALSGRIAPAR
ncbi:MAG: hypothetical protein BMS9Abin28_0936 [Anaerolineae bacterium]|nr:MAG: hypothetical protein BMS9Abin28_0936 [Anaerolineae bacterium]